MQHVLIIGAGLGGLAAALRLSHRGFKVTVLEKLSRPGGRSNVIEENGFRADTGPTILVMKDEFEELYRSIDRNLSERLELVRIEPNYRIYFHDGTHLDLCSNMTRLAREVERIESGSAERLLRFLGEGAMKYKLGMDFVRRNYDHITDLMNPVAALRLFRTRSYQNLYEQVSKTFNENEKLAKAFSFHSMFLGLSPFDALAMYSLITYADLVMGMWYPKGGIYRLVEDMVTLSRESGVEIRTNAPVREIIIDSQRAMGVMLASGERIQGDIVVSNADLPYTYSELIPSGQRKDYPDKRLESMKFGCSGYILHLGLDRTYAHLQHQALYFSEHYRANLDAIFKTKTLPRDPSFHMSVPTVTDPALAPAGHSLVYLLAPMPNLESGIDWNQAAPMVREGLLNQLEQIISPDIRQHIVWSREYRPTDWLNDVNAVHGTAFGSLSHGFFQSSYFRPHNKARKIRGLYFVGQGTYPGIGMPMVIISSLLVTKRIMEEDA